VAALPTPNADTMPLVLADVKPAELGLCRSALCPEQGFTFLFCAVVFIALEGEGA
jgi:hypothetical protein